MFGVFFCQMAWATKTPNLYLPATSSCAVYQGEIQNRQSFPLWVEKDRRLIIKVDNDLRIAVSIQERVLPPYQINPLENTNSEYTFRTTRTGNHTISVVGSSPQAKITFCLS